MKKNIKNVTKFITFCFSEICIKILTRTTKVLLSLFHVISLIYRMINTYIYIFLICVFITVSAILHYNNINIPIDVIFDFFFHTNEYIFLYDTLESNSRFRESSFSVSCCKKDSKLEDIPTAKVHCTEADTSNSAKDDTDSNVKESTGKKTEDTGKEISSTGKETVSMDTSKNEESNVYT